MITMLPAGCQSCQEQLPEATPATYSVFPEAGATAEVRVRPGSSGMACCSDPMGVEGTPDLVQAHSAAAPAQPKRIILIDGGDEVATHTLSRSKYSVFTILKNVS